MKDWNIRELIIRDGVMMLLCQSCCCCSSEKSCKHFSLFSFFLISILTRWWLCFRAKLDLCWLHNGSIFLKRWKLIRRGEKLNSSELKFMHLATPRRWVQMKMQFSYEFSIAIKWNRNGERWKLSSFCELQIAPHHHLHHHFDLKSCRKLHFHCIFNSL